MQLDQSYPVQEEMLCVFECHSLKMLAITTTIMAFDMLFKLPHTPSCHSTLYSDAAL